MQQGARWCGVCCWRDFAARFGLGNSLRSRVWGAEALRAGRHLSAPAPPACGMRVRSMEVSPPVCLTACLARILSVQWSVWCIQPVPAAAETGHGGGRAPAAAGVLQGCFCCLERFPVEFALANRLTGPPGVHEEGRQSPPPCRQLWAPGGSERAATPLVPGRPGALEAGPRLPCHILQPARPDTSGPPQPPAAPPRLHQSHHMFAMARSTTPGLARSASG